MNNWKKRCRSWCFTSKKKKKSFPAFVQAAKSIWLSNFKPLFKVGKKKMVSTFWSQCTSSRHNTQSNIHNTWFLKRLCHLVDFRFHSKSFQHSVDKLTGSYALGHEVVDLIYWQGKLLDDSSQAGRLPQPWAKLKVTSIQRLPQSHLRARALLLLVWSSPLD